MIDAKNVAAWIVICLVTAAVTIGAFRLLDKPMGLQQKVASYGK